MYGLEIISCLANAVAWIGRNQAVVGKRGWPLGRVRFVVCREPGRI